MKETSGAFKTLWGTSDGIAGDGGAKGLRLFLLFYLFTFLPFYFFTFKSPFLPLNAFFLKNSLNFAILCNIFSNFAPKS